VKIKADQEQLDRETLRIDQSPRLPDGSLSRINSIGLLKLPPTQAQLADRVAKLNDRLGSLGGIVYLWANNDIHDVMTTVHDALAGRITGESTQNEQKRIVAELDAMIQSLAVEPKKQEFAQRDAGGGGGGKGSQKPQLPPEAELRLMKQFELAINGQTIVSDQQHAPAPELVPLGQRQQKLRGLLDQLLQKFSQGQYKLGPEPPNKNMLPEEMKPAASANDQLAQQLLAQPATSDDQSDKSVTLLGDRMARVGQRLAINDDPGKVTQTIEQNILAGLDQLIEQARQQQSSSSSQQQQASSQQNPQITQNPSNQSSQNTQTTPRSSSPAQSSNVAGSAPTQTDLSQDIRQNMREWGGLSDRQRQAVIQGASDTVIEQYKNMVDDYYRALAEKKP
jgi:hypothetical protein